MPYELRWIVEDHLLLLDMNGPITAEEADLINHHTHSVMENTPGTHMVHVITDVAAASLGSQPLSYAKLNPPKTVRSGWAIVVGDQKLVSFSIQLIVRLLDVQMKHLQSVDEAIAFVRERDIAVQHGLESQTDWETRQPIT